MGINLVHVRREKPHSKVNRGLLHEDFLTITGDWSNERRGRRK